MLRGVDVRGLLLLRVQGGPMSFQELYKLLTLKLESKTVRFIRIIEKSHCSECVCGGGQQCGKSRKIYYAF